MDSTMILNKEQLKEFNKWCASELKKDDVANKVWDWCCDNYKSTAQYYLEIII